MSSTVSIQKRILQLKKIYGDIDNILYDTAKGATIRAVEKATELTPPTANDLRGTNTRTGELKQHWASDSKTEPVGGALSGGNSYTTILANNMQYASYVNDGHRMDRHFVPGLVINEESGMLEYNPDGKGGIVVGTKTKYVKGKFMVDKAKEIYEEVIKNELDKKIGEAFK